MLDTNIHLPLLPRIVLWIDLNPKLQSARLVQVTTRVRGLAFERSSDLVLVPQL
jgi:hypothetical protein